MATRTVQLTVAKCEEEELDNVRTYLQNLEQVLKDNDCYDEDDYSDEYNPDDFYERQQEELQERAMECTCGAWKLGKSGEVYHVADCCCGAE